MLPDPVHNVADRPDLVVAAFSLCELGSAELRRAVVSTLWAHTTGALVLLEHGNHQGAGIILEARDHVGPTIRTQGRFL